ncbi:hypothetical protein [Synechococcus phage S-N03]|uniref:Tail fiber protein n=1 Tax=Synechococcus phage S-N03 TaxID=2718943 RepID=A0A6G8R5I6_9CAUD|nr:tail collar fiber protein [Synechococcus phage S-N03]QIN96646.1 hypothetical protein [Synechococcus phage S-N03]
MALNFPASPSNSQEYVAPNGVTYIYDAAAGLWYVKTSDAIGTSDINDGAITTAKLADDAVTGGKLANDITISTTGDLTANSLTLPTAPAVGYQQGLWTPAPTQGSATILAASWTRIGNQVTVHLNLQAFTDTSSAVEIEIGGLPYNRNSQFTVGTCRTAYLNYGENRTVASSIMASNLIRVTSSIPSVGGTTAGPVAYAEYTNFITANQSQTQFVSSLTYLTDDTTWTPSNGATVS